MNRRDFLLSSAALPGARLFPMRAEAGSAWSGPAVVRKAYLAPGRPSWPRPDVDIKQAVGEIEAGLAEVARRNYGQIEFTGGDILTGADEVAAWVAREPQADVVLAFNMVTIVYPVLKALTDTGKPALMFAQPYSGHDWTHAAALMQKGAKLELIASSDFSDLDEYVPLFRAIHHLRHSKVLLVARPNAAPKTDGYTARFGTAFALPSYLDLKTAYDAASAGTAQKLADEFIGGAVKVVEPAHGEIVNSLRLHMAIASLLEKEQANAIAIDCLGGFGRGELPAYPCISFSKLNDAGLYGVCECDLESTMTQLLVTSFSGRPGFVSDPVFDTSRGEVIHAHCVSATKLKGIGGPSSPYIVRSHLEDHKGASLQVLAPGGDAVTVARFANPELMMISAGEALGNVDDERGCRTKIRTRVKDSRKLLENWSAALTGGPGMPGTRDLLHRVVFYGDHVKAVERLGRMTGFKVVKEDA